MLEVNQNHSGYFTDYQTISHSNQIGHSLCKPVISGPPHYKYKRTSSRIRRLPTSSHIHVTSGSPTQCSKCLYSKVNLKKFTLRSFAVIFLSYTGAAALVVLLTYEYFQYHTTTRIEIINPTQSELPAFSICLFYILPEMRFKKTFDNWHESSLTLGEINSRLPNFSEFVVDCKVLGTNYNYTPCINITPNVTEYLSLYSKCYSLFEKMDPIVYEDGKVGSNYLIRLRLNTTNLTTKTMAVYVTHNTQELDEALGNPAFLQFDFEHNNRGIATFERTVIKSLESPYDSDCRDYLTEPCVNRYTCIKQCVHEALHKSSRRFDTGRYVKLLNRRLNGRFGIRNDSVDTQACLDEFKQPPCDDYIYRTIPGIQIHSPYTDNGTFDFSLSYPLGAEVTVQYIPYRPFLDYLIFVFSVISLCTEFSILRTLNGLTNCMDVGLCKKLNLTR